jgi:hypothetical protein
MPQLRMGWSRGGVAYVEIGYELLRRGFDLDVPGRGSDRVGGCTV